MSGIEIWNVFELIKTEFNNNNKTLASILNHKWKKSKNFTKKNKISWSWFNLKVVHIINSASFLSILVIQDKDFKKTVSNEY